MFLFLNKKRHKVFNDGDEPKFFFCLKVITTLSSAAAAGTFILKKSANETWLESISETHDVFEAFFWFSLLGLYGWRVGNWGFRYQYWKVLEIRILPPFFFYLSFSSFSAPRPFSLRSKAAAFLFSYCCRLSFEHFHFFIGSLKFWVVNTDVMTGCARRSDSKAAWAARFPFRLVKPYAIVEWLFCQDSYGTTKSSSDNS